MRQFAVIGIGRFGGVLATELHRMGHEVLVIDKSEEVIQKISNIIDYAVVADATDENALRSLGIKNFDVVIVAVGSDVEANIMVSLILKDMGVECVLAKAQTDHHAKVLEKIGVDKIVFPERDMGERIAASISSSNVLDYIELSSEYSITEYSLFKAWEGKTIRELNIGERYGVTVLALKKANEPDKIEVSPSRDTLLSKGDILVLIGTDANLGKIERKHS